MPESRGVGHAYSQNTPWGELWKGGRGDIIVAIPVWGIWPVESDWDAIAFQSGGERVVLGQTEYLLSGILKGFRAEK